MGAIASGGVRVLNRNVLSTLQIPEATVEAVTQSEQRELERREHLYRDNRPAANVLGLAVLLVDDGLATGSTMLAAMKVLRQQQAARIVAAVPLGSPDTCEDLRHAADEVICATTPAPFHSVGCWYEEFSQTGDDEVRELLDRARPRLANVLRP